MLAAIGEQGESAAQGVEGISAQALAEGDLQALNDFAGVFSTLCNELLDGGKGDRPPSGSSSAGPRPACTTARPASAIPASICAPAGAAEAELGPTGGEEEAEAIDVTDGACASAHAACAAACSESLAAAVADDNGVVAAATKPKKPVGVKVQRKTPSGLMTLNAISQAAAQRRRPRSAGGGPPPVSKPIRIAGGGGSTHLEAEIAALQAKILGREAEGPATTALGKAIKDE